MQFSISFHFEFVYTTTKYHISFCFSFIPQELKERNRQRKAESQCFESICDFVFMHGRSNHESRCRYRHLFIKDDLPPTEFRLTQKSVVRFELLQTISPTNFIIRLLDVRDSTKTIWKTLNRSNEYAEFLNAFNSYYADEKNQLPPMNVNAGDLCVILHNDKPQRARVLKKYENQ